MEEINRNLSRFNESWDRNPFHLSVSMGYTEFGTEDDAETFLMHMDEKMYEEKRKYHMRRKQPVWKIKYSITFLPFVR